MSNPPTPERGPNPSSSADSGPPSHFPPPLDNPLDYDDHPPLPGDNGAATGSLVCSLTGIVCCGVPALVGFVLGIVAMKQIEETGQRGRGMALAGVVLGAIVALLWSPFWIWAADEALSSAIAGWS